MESYSNFIGIDIGKFSFVVSHLGSKKTNEFNNVDSGIALFIKEYSSQLEASYIVLEVTGGYEMLLLLTLCELGHQVHRANTRKVKNFIRSYGNTAKTDNLDAKALALYGSERWRSLKIFTPQSKQAVVLFELVQRRHDLKDMLVAEKNRLKAPRAKAILSSCNIVITALSEQLLIISDEINFLIKQDPILSQKKDVLKTIPGIGEITANELIVLMPELGSLNRREVASLAGVAPLSNDSGKYSGYRKVSHGRDKIKPILFMAAMAARNSNSHLKSFYNRLIEAGKSKMVALVALMRKIIVIANAKLKELFIKDALEEKELSNNLS